MASKYCPNPNPVIALTEVGDTVMGTAGALITKATQLWRVPTDVDFTTSGIEALVARCNGSQWACWSSEKKRDVVIGSICAAFFLVFIIVCCCCPVARHRGNGISDEEYELENVESGGSTAPNITGHQSKKRQSRSWLRSGVRCSLEPRVEQSCIVPLSDISTSSSSPTLPRDTELTDDHSDFQFGKRGLAAGRMHQAWQGSPRLSREPSTRVAIGRPTLGSSYDPLRTSRGVRGVPGDTSRITRQNRGHPPKPNNRNYRPRRGFFIPGPHKNMARAQMPYVPSPLRRELTSSDISSSPSSSRDSISSLERNVSPPGQRGGIGRRESPLPSRRESRRSHKPRRRGSRSQPQVRAFNNQYSNPLPPQWSQSIGGTTPREPAMMSGGLSYDDSMQQCRASARYRRSG